MAPAPTPTASEIEEPLLPVAEPVGVANVAEEPQYVEDPPTIETDPAQHYEDRLCSFLGKNYYRICVAVIIVLLACRLFVTGSIVPADVCLTPHGPSEVWNVYSDPYHKLAVALPGNAYIKQANKLKMTIEGSANVLKQVESSVNNGEFHIALKSHCYRDIHQNLNLHIEIPDLDQIALTGSGDVHANFDNPSSNSSLPNKTIHLTGSGDMTVSFPPLNVMNTKLTGSGTLSLTGSAQTHKVGLTGSGDIQAFQFPTQNTTVNMVGSGDVKIAVNQSLTVRMFGSGDVRYMGDPVVKKSGFGSGSVKKVGAVN